MSSKKILGLFWACFWSCGCLFVLRELATVITAWERHSLSISFTKSITEMGSIYDDHQGSIYLINLVNETKAVFMFNSMSSRLLSLCIAYIQVAFSTTNKIITLFPPDADAHIKYYVWGRHTVLLLYRSAVWQYWGFPHTSHPRIPPTTKTLLNALCAQIDNECLSQALMLALSTAASGTCWWGRLTADGDHAVLNFLSNFNHWICGGEFVKLNKIDWQLPVEYYFKQTECFGSEIWKVNMDYCIFYNENVCEMFWIEIFTV